MRRSLKIFSVANARPQLHKIGKILLGSDHRSLELWKALPQTKRTSPAEKKKSAVLCLQVLSAQQLSLNPAYSDPWLWSGSFSPDVGPNDKWRLSPLLAPAAPGIRLGSIFKFILRLPDF